MVMIYSLHMPRSPRTTIDTLAAAAALATTLLLTACSSGSYSNAKPERSAPLAETSTTVDPVKACPALIAAPAGYAQQRAAEIGCIQDGNGNWVPLDQAAPADPAALPVHKAQPEGGVPWNQAVDYAWTIQRVCGPLAGGGNSEGDVFLNLGRDYPDKQRFQIVVWDVGGLEPIDGGVTLCASGQITLHEGVAQIELTDPGLIEVYK